MDTTILGGINASTAPMISVTWCSLITISSIKMCTYSSTALWGSMWGTLNMEYIMHETGTTIPTFCSKRELRWRDTANIMLKHIRQLSLINQVGSTRF